MAIRMNKVNTITLEKGIQLYLSTLETEGKSPRYIKWLRERLQLFIKQMHDTYGEECKLQDMTLEDGRELIRELMSRDKKYLDHPLVEPRDGKLAIEYIHGFGRAVRSFSSWAHEEGYLSENIMQRLKLPKLPKIQPEPLSEEEIKRVLEECLYHTLESLRNYSMMMLFLDTGLRLSELMNLKQSKIDFALGEMTILGKGNKERKVPIGSQAKKAMIDYLSKERPDPQSPQIEDNVYLSAQGYQISSTVIQKVFQRVRKAAGVPRLHPHMCRHTFSVRYLIHGGDVFSLQKILGHSSLQMTQRYVNLASSDVKDKHRRFSPMDNLNFRGSSRGRPRLQTK